MRAGKLITRLIVERWTTAPGGEIDETGNVRQDWQEVGRCRADFRETVGKEKVELGRIEDQRTATARVRRTSFTESMSHADRVQTRGQVWSVASVALVGDGRRWVDLLLELDG